VALSGAVNARVYASWAEIIVAVVTDAAMEVLVIHGVVAAVAIHNPGSTCCCGLGAESQWGVVRLCQLVKEGCSSGQRQSSFVISSNSRQHLPWRVVNGLGTGASPSSVGFSDETVLIASYLGASGERAITGETGATA
jgi:hypothetical protein